MSNRLKPLALLFAGALASVFFTLLLQSPAPECIILIVLGIIVFILLLFGSDMMSKLWKCYILFNRKRKKMIGIFNDMKWDSNDNEISNGTIITPNDWKDTINKLAVEHKVKIKIKTIDRKKNFDSFFAILNPYGSVYPESNSIKFETLNKIFNYVSEGGLFINVADIPGYWAYNPLIKRKIDTTEQIFSIDNSGVLNSIRPFEFTPFMKKLSLQVLNIERTKYFNWEIEFEKRYDVLRNKIIDENKIKVHRAVVFEKNVEAIIKSEKLNDDKTITPFYFVKYGNGKFLISLLWMRDEFPQNIKIKDLIIETVLNLIK